MTRDEAYAVLGVNDPIRSGSQWADKHWGVDGQPLDILQTLLGEDADVFRIKVSLIPFPDPTYAEFMVEAFVTSAKARLFDLYMGSLHHRGNA
ncbi:hypothetical protein J2D73_19280 [Acetobacter sacchari]|uniref:Uncharacterized protein n=1 Tax=Acetobacter sacchari TaxID=2661687 RepID=A0ABS3M178_9PROT|nr:hypothetical protein [Acetobacter sacchari]MBO1361929.1 hypothetical protein [Acetobacter sacchari]